MEWRWSWFGTTVWNTLIHAVTLQWGALPGDIEELKNWWRSFWGDVSNRLTDLRNWAQGRISYLSGYAYGLFVRGVNLIYSVRNTVYNVVSGWVNTARSYAASLYNLARSLAWDLYSRARGFAQNLVNGVYAWVRPYIDNAVNWVRGLYQWIQPYRDLITDWLGRVRSAIDWLRYQAWGRLQRFLADPIGFVLGWLLDPIRNLINWWKRYGPLLMNFVANELAELYTLWANGKRILKALVNNPEGFILDLLAPMFLDWLAGLIADNW
jgi:hypothetical protein